MSMRVLPIPRMSARLPLVLLAVGTMAGIGYSAWRHWRAAGVSGAGIDASFKARQAHVAERGPGKTCTGKSAIEPVASSTSGGPSASAPTRHATEHVSPVSGWMRVPNTTEDATRVTLFGQLADGTYAAEIMDEGEVPYARYWRNAIDQVMVYVIPEREQLDAILIALAEGRIEFSALQQYGGTKGGFSDVPI